MTTKEILEITSASIAVISICVNVVMGITIYRLNRGNLKRDEILAVLRSLLERLEYTRLFEIDPEQEIWEFGFDSLKELNLVCAPAIVASRSSRYVSSDVLSAVEQLSRHVKDLRALQDSWRVFRRDKEGDWRSIQETWPELQRATSALQNAQPVAAQCKTTLSSFLALK